MLAGMYCRRHWNRRISDIMGLGNAGGRARRRATVTRYRVARKRNDFKDAVRAAYLPAA